MPYLTFIALIAVAGIICWLLFDLKKKFENRGNDKETAIIQEKLAMLLDENRELRRAMDAKLSETHHATQRQYAESAKIIESITDKLTKLDETNKQVINFSSQLQNLQDILKNPKQRGVLGEYFLEETLKNVLPPNSYEMQYAFEDGTIVDAVVKVKDKIIPIDSKFSLENYERILNANDQETREKLEGQFKQDLKFRIDETSKYVKPEEKTMDFAFMFIPSEAIYYDLLVNKVGAVKVNTRDLIEYAFRDKHVIIVSPTSFLAYLQTVLQGLKALQIEESAKEIKKWVEMLGKHILSYEDFLKKLGASMGTAVNHYNNAYHEFKKIDKDIVKITEGEAKVETLRIEKPDLE
ncbi:MAG: DNA recombination protein RmuC [bacterium]|nr:DNA recombination protein RmuC [bacterium]